MENVLSWFDVPTNDFSRAIKFYSDILGKPVRVDESMGQKLGLFPMKGKEGVGGAILSPSRELRPGNDGTRVYLNCEGKLDEVIGRVEQAGGKILQPKFSLGEPGSIAFIQDTEGNTIGLHSKQ